MYRSSCRRLLTRLAYSNSHTVPRCCLSSFAVVHHGDAYETSMQGLHGQQLALAQREGEGKDDPDFDPFLEEELEEARKLAEAEKDEEGDDDDEEGDDKDLEDGEVEAEEEPNPAYFSTFDYKKYNNDGSLRRNASEMAILRAGAPAGGQVAIVQLAGTQFKVTTDDVLIVNKLLPIRKYEVGSIHTLSDILLVTNSSTTLVGQPLVKGAEVDFMVEEITRDMKLVIFKKTKNSRRKAGFRRDVCMLRILDIRMPAPYDAIPYTERPEPAPLVDTRPLYTKYKEYITPKK